MTLTRKQVDQLLKPIAPQRVLRDGKGHSHVSQQDILAHLIRVFGFGNFDTDVLDASLIFEQERETKGRYDVCYRATVRLTVRDPEGREIAHYENGSTATAQNQTRGDAHDLAFKSAISLSVKRAAIALGDQFGLSLYNKGQTSALVIDSLVKPDAGHGWEAGSDLQRDVPQQFSLGNDEIDREMEGEEPRPAKAATLKDAVKRHQAEPAGW